MRVLVMLAVLAAPSLAFAQQVPQARPPGEPSFACPPHLWVVAEQRIEVPQGWRVQPDTQMHWLRGAELFDGEPAERAQLREDGENRQQRSAWWDLAPGNTRGYFLVCRYEGMEAGVVARVPDSMRRCTVTTYRDNSRGVRHGRVVIGPDNWVRVTCR